MKESFEQSRFWKYVSKTSTCWLWTGCTTAKGYGRFNISGKVYFAHRISYQLSGRTIPPSKEIDHICRVKNCVNPDHLRAVTHRTNMLEHSIAPVAFNAQKTMCKNGHPLEGDNLMLGITNCGTIARRCRTCATDSFKRWHAEHYIKKGNFHARKTHCAHGHLLSGDNVDIRIVRGHPTRRCLACRAEHEKNRRKRDPHQMAEFRRRFKAKHPNYKPPCLLANPHYHRDWAREHNP